MSEDDTIPGATPLADCPEVTVGLALPSPLSERLDRMVSIAERAGERTSRKELVSSLLLNAPLEGNELSELVRALRLATAQDALPGTSEVVVKARRPGPRSRAQRRSHRAPGPTDGQRR